MNINFRTAILSDMNELQQLYVDTIEHVCASEYNESERKVWASGINNTQRWLDVLNTQYVLLAVVNDTIAGFATLKEGNYIDFFYVHKNFQRMGIAQQLLSRIEQEAAHAGTAVLSSDISKTARAFFEKQGYRVIKEQHHPRENVVLVNYKMERELKCE